MSAVEIVHLAGCASSDLARQRVQEALGVIGRPDVEVRLTQVGPDGVIPIGSPSIALDGRELFDSAANAGGWACRIYLDEAGRAEGVPSLAAMVKALRAGLETPTDLVGSVVGKADKRDGR